MARTQKSVSIQPLYSNAAIRERIQDLFSGEHTHKQRVICAAYVGQDCLDFIPFAKGITVYCSKEPGATSADGLDRLISRGATVYFVRNLHAKLYWTEGVGVVIGSSNLTSNGMDDDRLIECGVFIPDSSAIDPRRLIRGKGKRATPADIAELRRMSGLLRIARREVLGRGTGAATGGRISAPVTFDEWMTFAGPRTLRVAEFEAAMEWSTEGSEFVKDKWGRRASVKEEIWSKQNNWYREGEWVLGLHPKTGAVEEWTCITDVVPTPIAEPQDPEFPYLSLQRAGSVGRPPFRTDARFRRAFAAGFKAWGGANKWRRLNTEWVPLSLLREVGRRM